MKKTISIILALVLLVGAIAVTPVSAARPKKTWIQVDSMDSDFALVNQCNDCKIEVDTVNKIEGEASIKFDMADFHIRPQGLFTFMCLDLFEEAIDIDEMPIFEFYTYVYEDIDKSKIGGQAVQINFIDSDADGSDGLNTNNTVEGQLANTWVRRKIDLTGKQPEEKGGSIIPLSRDNIDMLRISGLQYCDDYYELDMNIDSLVFMTTEEYNARNAEEESLSATILAIPMITEQNIGTTGPQYLAAKEQLENDLKNHPNFNLTDAAAAYLALLNDAYILYNKAIYVQEAHDAIEAIGELNRDNYLQKRPLLVAAEEKVAKLDEIFGEGQYTLDNKQVLLDARATFDSLNEEVLTVIADIKALPARVALKLEDGPAVRAVKAEFEALTEDQQFEVGSENQKTLMYAYDRILELEAEAKLLGDIDGNGEVNATDALVALQVSSGKKTVDDAHYDLGDVNGDKTVNATDALLILQFSAGKIKKFPREN